MYIDYYHSASNIDLHHFVEYISLQNN